MRKVITGGLLALGIVLASAGPAAAESCTGVYNSTFGTCMKLFGDEPGCHTVATAAYNACIAGGESPAAE